MTSSLVPSLVLNVCRLPTFFQPASLVLVSQATGDIRLPGNYFVAETSNMTNHYDIIIIGTGSGGSTLAL